MKLNQAFTIRFKGLLHKENKNIYEFCKENGIARSTIMNVINGGTKIPTFSTIYQVARGFGLNVIEFLNCEIFIQEDITREECVYGWFYKGKRKRIRVIKR